MPIAPSDIVFRLSVVTASAGDTTAGTPAGALGDQVSTTAITTAQMNNLWDDTSGAESAAGDVEYRCIFVLNNHATLTATNVDISVLSQAANGGSIDIALDGTAVSAKGASGAQAVTIANEQTAPSGAGAFGAGPLSIGSLAPGQVKGIWLRRTVTAGATGADPDGVVLQVGYDTLP